ncbi:methyltransferase domain-containing protein [Seohaeicola zhoushanensis]
MLDGLEVTGKRILDIGCGSGAIAVMLVRDLGAAHVTGIDVEAPVCAAATRRAAEAGLSGRIAIREVTPGPLAFSDASFDIVYSKDRSSTSPTRRRWPSRSSASCAPAAGSPPRTG